MLKTVLLQVPADGVNVLGKDDLARVGAATCSRNPVLRPAKARPGLSRRKRNTSVVCAPPTAEAMLGRAGVSWA